MANGWGELLVCLNEAVGFLSYVVEVEHVIQVAVLVGDDVKHHMPIFLIGIDVMENHQSITIKAGGHRFSCLFIDDVKQSLERETTPYDEFRLICFCNKYPLIQITWVWTTSYSSLPCQ